MKRWIVVFVLIGCSCRGKENASAPAGSGERTKPSSTDRWSAFLTVGKSSGLLSLASGPIGTFVVGLRDPAAVIAVNGKELLAASPEKGEAYVQFDAKGSPVWSAAIDGTRETPSLVVGEVDAIAGVPMVEVAGKGAIASLPKRDVTPIDGNVDALVRTASGTIWVAGRNWGSDDPLANGKCDGKSFLARRTDNGPVEVIDCDRMWGSIHLAAIEEDAVMCASNGNQIGGAEIVGQTYLARIGADGKLKWLRYVNEVGDASCEDVVVTSDGDIVAAGVANENVDLSEGSRARGVKVKSSGGHGLDRLWLVRYVADGTRRWARIAAESTVGFSADLDADRGGNAVLTTSIATPLDLGHGPVGPQKGATIVGTIDRDANVTGLLTTGFTDTEKSAVDSRNGLVFAFASSDPITVAGVDFAPPSGGVQYIGLVRIPLPLPKP